MIVVGDLNARTASLSPLPDHLARSSLDASTDARGRRLVSACHANDLVVLNGTRLDIDSPGIWTSHQYNGTAVVDYVLASLSALPLCRAMAVSDKTEWSDHAYISLDLELPPALTNDLLRHTPANPLEHPPPPPPPTVHPHLDDLLGAAVASSCLS
ncbi:hypothetical protein OBBRIDRAFT_711509, partial [Obba rivulosa]